MPMPVRPGEQTYRFRISRSAAAGISRGVQQFDVALEDRMTVLDALFRVEREQDPLLSFRCACRVGMCGTCAMSIDGIPRLACKTRVRPLGLDVVHVAPLPNLPVVKDLVVSLDSFFDQWKRTLPKFRPRDPESKTLAVIPQTSA
jgi:succinate dehydrogenase / fumarate reductase iron-sulfur subunit/fumarate reductase iron-sulfur subunit